MTPVAKAGCGSRTARVVRVCCAFAAVIAATQCTSPGSRIVPAGDTAGVRDDGYRYVIDPTCDAHIRSASRMPDDIAANNAARTCAYQQDLKIRQLAQALLRAEARKQGEVMMDIPEFHDEQRLPISGNKLGPKAGIYVSPFLGTFRHRWQLETHGSPGVLAAYVVILQEGGEQFPSEYTDLGLAWGVNCLFIEAVTAGGYKATMVQGTPAKPCREHDGTVPGTSKALQVTTRALGGSLTQDSVVPAARFQEDNEARAVFGLPCLNEWCQIGRVGKTPQQDSYCNWKTTDSDPVLNWTCAGKEMLVPSWYDEQILDTKVGNDWVGTGIRAAIVPQEDIDKKPESDFSTPQHIATVYLKTMPDPSSKYYRNGLRKGANKVELVKRPSGYEFLVTAPASPSPRTWKVLGPHKHYDAPIPGTTRWRFTVRDIGIWGPCGQNCCDTDGFQ